MYNVTASLEGYEPATVTITVPADGSGAQHAFHLVSLGGAAAALTLSGAASGWGLPRRFGALGGLSSDAMVRPSCARVLCSAEREVHARGICLVALRLLQVSGGDSP